MSNPSLNEQISNITKRYSLLFTFPSHVKIVIAISILCMLGAVFTTIPLQLSYSGLAVGLLYGMLFFFFTQVSDFVISKTSMRGDPIFNLRRCSTLSFSSLLVWFGIILLGSLISSLLQNLNLWIKFFFLGFSVSFMLRLLVFSSTSFADFGRTFISAILQPSLCTLPFSLVGASFGFVLDPHLSILILVSILISVLSISIFIYLLDRVGKESLGITSFSLFKAFLANWTEGLNLPLEVLFEKLGSEQDVKVSLITFRTNEKMKAKIVVPAIHPGPFKNLGSSTLPSLIQTTLEDQLKCVVSVPHGLVGHDLDLSSQMQNRRVVEGILNFVDSLPSHSSATPFVRTSKDGATASCQIFGDCALLTLTLAPKTMEDLPQELDSFIVKEAKTQGLSALAVDAHNSINGPFNIESAVVSFQETSLASLYAALNYEQSTLKVGAKTIVPHDFDVNGGMGPGGISVIVTKIGDQKAAYVTIDGNNMISGLRERILSELRSIGIDDGEILTTDNHAVCGVVKVPRGYHPLGEVIDQSKLISYIKQAAVDALGNLEPAKVSRATVTIPEVNVIGEKQIEELCYVADKTAKQAMRTSISLFPITSLFLILLFFLL